MQTGTAEGSINSFLPLAQEAYVDALSFHKCSTWVRFRFPSDAANRQTGLRLSFQVIPKPEL